MLKYIKKTANKFYDDVVYNTGRMGAMATGKTIIEIGAAQMLTTLGLFAAGAASGGPHMMLLALVAVPLLGAFAVGLAEIDHLHRRSRLKNQYREEVAQKLGKKPLSVTEQDLELVAKGDPAAGIEGNKTLSEALSESRKERNLSAVISVISTVAVFFAVKFLANALNIHASPQELGEAFSAGNVGAVASQIGSFALKGVLAVATYYSIKTPLHWVGGEVLGLEKETVNEKIMDIKRERRRGREISPEQVFELYAEAHPEIQNAVRYEYGHSFHHLSRADQRLVVEEAAGKLGLEQITQDINTNRIKPEELAFAVEFQESGVERRVMDSRPVKAAQGMFAHVKNKVSGLFAAPASVAQEAETLVAQTGAPTVVTVNAESPDKTAQVNVEAYAEQNPSEKRSFVQMVGRKSSPGIEAMSHVERLESTSEPLLQR